MKTALIAGATGLVGNSLLQRLIADSYYSSILALTRKPLDIINSKVKNVIVNFDSLADLGNLQADDVFCCLGTTIKKAGSKEAFWKVDHDYPFTLAKITYENQAKQFLLVSALGADQESSFYYNVVKAKVEEGIAEIPFMSYHIFRPSLLLGERSDTRPGEEAAKRIYRIFDFIIPSKYKAIDGRKVAASMLHFAKLNLAGKHIHSSAEMQQLTI